jgi:hypothetical protein
VAQAALDLQEYKMNREQRRRNKKLKVDSAKSEQTKENEVNEVSEKVALFDKLPDACNACNKTFNKKNKMQVSTWSVVVRNDTEQVRLYCPDCWSKAKAVVQAYEKENGYGRTEE